MRWSEKRTRIGLLIALSYAISHSAAAQVTFGSPADPPRIVIGGGAFDVVPNAASKKPGVGPTGMALGEYRFGDVLWIVAPFVGAVGSNPPLTPPNGQLAPRIPLEQNLRLARPRPLRPA